MTDGEALAARLRHAIAAGRRLFDSIPEHETTRRPVDGGWCAREVIGHLIDSACNNHRRFVVNQQATRLVVDGYEQDEWVSQQRYADMPAAELLAFWAAYNGHIARVLEGMSDEALSCARGPLAEYRFGYIPPPTTPYVTLGYLADDYVGHVDHHLKQIASLLVRSGPRR